MPSILLSDNGVSSGSAGLKSTAASDGSLALQTTTAGGSATTAVTIDTSQNVGLGVTPSAWGSASRALQMQSGMSLFSNTSGLGGVGNNVYSNPGTGDYYIANGYATRYYQYNGTHVWNTAASGTAGNAISFTQAMTLDASGNLLVGTTASSSARLYVRGSGTTSATASFEASNSSGATRLYVQDDGTTRFFGSSGSETARIDSSGNLLVGTTSVFGAGGISIQPSAGAPTVDVKGSATTNGSSVFNVYSTGASAYRFYVGMGGTISATSTTITGISDRRLKENIRDLDDGLEKVMALQPRKFDWKEGKGADVKNARGFIAQEFEQVFPDLIEQWKDEPPEGEEPYKAVRADLIPTLVKAIQEQQAIIEQLKARLDAANL